MSFSRHTVTISRGRSRGFTLLEVLLAFVVFALSFAVVLEVLAGSMRSTARARNQSEVALLAQSLVDMVGTEIPLREGSLDGEAVGGYQWTMTISTYVPQAEDVRTLELAELSGTLLYWLDLEVRWGMERRPQKAHFETIRSQLADFQP